MALATLAGAADLDIEIKAYSDYMGQLGYSQMSLSCNGRPGNATELEKPLGAGISINTISIQSWAEACSVQVKYESSKDVLELTSDDAFTDDTEDSVDLEPCEQYISWYWPQCDSQELGGVHVRSCGLNNPGIATE